MGSSSHFYSIIIPCYKSESVIERALHGVRTQTYSNWEIIAVIDGNDDQAPAIVERFGSSVEQPVSVLHHEKNLGVSAARNTAMRAARGNWFALLDADDFWTPEHLESVHEHALREKADLVYAEVYVVSVDDSGGIKHLPIDTIEVIDPPRDLFRRNFINPSAAAFSRRVYENVGDFDVSLHCVEDLDYWIRAAASGFKIKSTGRQTVYYRKSPGTLSQNIARIAESSGFVYLKNIHCGILPKRDIAKKAAGQFTAAGRIYFRDNPRDAARAFLLGWRARKQNFSRLGYAILAIVFSFLPVVARAKLYGWVKRQKSPSSINV